MDKEKAKTRATIRKLKRLINEVLKIDTPSASLDKRISHAYTHLTYVHNALHRYV